MTDDALRRIAAEQHSLVSRAQCRSLELDADAMRLRVGGEWTWMSPRVVRLTGAPVTPTTLVMAAVLDGGPAAVASHSTAAALWRLPGFSLLPAEVSRLRGGDGEALRLGRLHQPRLLPQHHTTVAAGVPVTTPARTLFDLASVLHPGRVERAVDNALARSPGLLTVMHRMLEELAERGRTGIRAMREILAARPVGYIAPASGLEARVIRLLDEVGIRTRRQVDLGGDDWIGRVDLLIEGTDVVIEVDSARFHSARLDRERDARRDDAFARLGLRVVRVPEEQVWSAPAAVVEAVRAALARSGTRITHPAA